MKSREIGRAVNTSAFQNEAPSQYRKQMPTNAFGNISSNGNTHAASQGNANNIKPNRKFKQGKIDIDMEQSCLVVNFEVEMMEDGRVVESIPEQRKIKIKTLTPDKNLAQMSEDIIEQCKYIHPSRIEEIEQLLIKLRRYQMKHDTKPSIEIPTDLGDDDGDMGMVNEFKHGGNSSLSKTRQKSEELPPSKIENLDDYMEMLYQVTSKAEKDREQGLKLQITGTAMILQLCRDILNLEQLIQNSTLMGALTRVLQDEHKRSLELTYNILKIFLAFSNFAEMHPIMTNYKIGALTMKVTEFELKRIEVREKERLEQEGRFRDEVAKLRKSGNSDSDEAMEKLKKARGKELFASHQLHRKQDKVLFVCFYILINLAEDISVERKMIKKDLILHLLSSLESTYGDLLTLTMSFIKKLSIFEENKEILKELNIVDKLMKFLNCSSQPLVNAVLRVYFNLSFDEGIREQLVKAGIIPKLIALLKTPSYRGRTLKLLYHLSVNDRCKSMITYTEAVPMLMGMIVNFPQPMLTKELAAVMINLSHNAKNVEQMITNRGLNYLMDRLDNTKDPLLLKIIRNISAWTYNQQKELENPEVQYRLRGLWSPHVKILLKLADERENHDILVEIFGCLANLTTQDLPNTLPWHKVLKEYNLLSIIAKLLVPGMAQNDLLLEIILLIGTITSDEKACDIISTSSLVGLMYQKWKDHGDDVEIQLQLLFCFYKLILFEKSREEVLYSTRVVIDIIECLTHRNDAIRELADKFCEIVLEYDRSSHGELCELGLQIRKKRFESYNSAWLSFEFCDSSSNDAHYDDDYKFDDDLYRGGNYYSHERGGRGPVSMDMSSMAGNQRQSKGYNDNIDPRILTPNTRERHTVAESKYGRDSFNDSASDRGEDSYDD